jgi:hypothetical protein
MAKVSSRIMFTITEGSSTGGMGANLCQLTISSTMSMTPGPTSPTNERRAANS